MSAVTDAMVEAAIKANVDAKLFGAGTPRDWVRAALEAALSSLPERGEAVDCPCTFIEQDETCPKGYPSLLCGVCGGKGHASQEDVSALAAEMLNIANELGEPEDPFAAWETLSLITSENERLNRLIAASPVPDQGEVERMRKALEAAKKRMRNCMGAIESNQVVDKDVHGSLKRGMADIDAALEGHTDA